MGDKEVRMRAASGRLGQEERASQSTGGEVRKRRRSLQELPAAPSGLDGSFLEIETTHTRGAAPRTESNQRVVEVWTRNRIYVLNGGLVCAEVLDRASNQLDVEHPFLGRRLVGGQRRDGEEIELSYPFPRPGTEAVFEEPEGPRGQFWQTSTVARVVLKLQVITVSPNSVVPVWEEISDADR